MSGSDYDAIANGGSGATASSSVSEDKGGGPFGGIHLLTTDHLILYIG
ncbi:hypothetical protein BQ8794_60115 [Mesorhizobium prunaredense]|uniref:Uncharacterized protein n=1 Tax=Mesorhizobium prunaredense TaxID=1631249 RepID=A0A1R3VG19_9HYPH|nr:hypothetical protein BQ8794_60115 [Mesorhizobium prunaredense]